MREEVCGDGIRDKEDVLRGRRRVQRRGPCRERVEMG